MELLEGERRTLLASLEAAQAKAGSYGMEDGSPHDQMADRLLPRSSPAAAASSAVAQQVGAPFSVLPTSHCDQAALLGSRTVITKGSSGGVQP